jgi:hypothetical protein
VALTLWPFVTGWAVIPNQEFVLNCISKERIGTFVGVSQMVSPILALIGASFMTFLVAYYDVPLRYAMAFILAYLLAQLASVFPLFTYETPSPQPPLTEPFWKPMYTAVSHDRTFQLLLGIIFLLYLLINFPLTFIPLLAIREWHMPDWVAAGYATIFSGAMVLGAAGVSWVARKTNYTKTLTISLAFLPLALLPLLLPRFPHDEYRFFVVAALCAIPYMGISVAIQSLVYILAPDHQRAGYLSAFQVISNIAPALAIFLSGLLFKPGNYQWVFGLYVVAICLILPLCHRYLLKPLEKRISTHQASMTNTNV